MRLHQTARDRQAETGTRRGAFVAPARRLTAIEAIEDPLQVGLGHAWATVTYADLHLTASAGGVYLDGAARRGVPKRVVEQTAQDPLQPVGIALESSRFDIGRHGFFE